MTAGPGTHLIHGLTVRVDRGLGLPIIDTANPDLHVQLTPATPSAAAVVHVRTDAEHDPSDDGPWVIETWLDDGRVRVEFTEWELAFEIDAVSVRAVEFDPGDEAAFDPDDLAHADLVEHALLDHVLPRVVSIRGDLALHAGGVVTPADDALLFVGASGAGKSTLVTSLALDGWRLLDDDGIRVVDDDSTLLAMPGYASVRLRDDSISAMPAEVAVGAPMAADPSKRWISFDHGAGAHLAHEPAPIRSTYVLHRVGRDEPVVRHRLSLPDAFDAVAAHVLMVDADHGVMVRRLFEQVGSLVATVPVHLLHVPDCLDRLAEVRDALDGWSRAGEP
jgi:hypothetical protein